MTDCTHGMPTPASCVDCMDEGNLPPAPAAEPVTIEATFVARFPGHCHGCNLPVFEGQRIHRLSNSQYAHEGCA